MKDFTLFDLLRELEVYDGRRARKHGQVHLPNTSQFASRCHTPDRFAEIPPRPPPKGSKLLARGRLGGLVIESGATLQKSPQQVTLAGTSYPMFSYRYVSYRRVTKRAKNGNDGGAMGTHLRVLQVPHQQGAVCSHQDGTDRLWLTL
jgi:hypothetical protein